MKKVIFGITSLSFGGAEKVLIDLVNELALKYNITVFTLYGSGQLEEQLDKNIKLINFFPKSYNELSKLQKIQISLKLLINKKSMYKKYIAKGNYNVEVAFLEGPITRLFSVKNKNVKKIAWIHNDIAQVFGKNIKAKIKIKLDKICYLYYNIIVFVSKDNKEQFENIYNIKNKKIIISNYISSKRVLEKSQFKFENVFLKSDINFLTVARLTKQKAIDRLIEVHSKLINENFKHKFYVIGDGPEKEYLKQLIKFHDVENTFILLGSKDNPYPYIKNCDIFALMSLYEGYGMVLEEAKILNKRILITDTAAREAVSNYNNSYIVPNTKEGIFEGLKHDIILYKKMGIEKKQIYLENYDIIKQIEKLVE